MKKRVLVVYAASTKIAFVTQLLENELFGDITTEIVYFSHSKSWYLRKWHRHFSECLHTIKLVLRILMLAPNSRIIIFGTNATRILYPFLLWTKFGGIYNELPSLKSKSLLFGYDKFIFEKLHMIYLSSEARIELVTKSYNLKRPIGLVSNIITFDTIKYANEFHEKKGIVYCGLISPGRFLKTSSQLQKLTARGSLKIDLFGFRTVGYQVNETFFDYKGNLPHIEMLDRLKNYKFGLLQYSQSDYNNEYCAPIKLYEYLFYGCIVLSVNRNRGLTSLETKYPGIIYFLDDLNFSYDVNVLDKIKFNSKSAERCMTDALQTNTALLSRLNSDNF